MTEERNWTYSNPVEIIFGAGKLSSLPFLIGDARVALITTSGFVKRGTVAFIEKILGASLVVVFDGVQPNPTFASVKDAYRNLISIEHDLLLALGGGSTIDTGKAVAAMKAAGSEAWIEDHLKHGAPFPDPFLPTSIIAVPSTAGTGSEVTMWGTIWSMKEKRKYSISHPLLYPQRAVLDPSLTLTLPEKETVYSGLDALSHAIEALWNKNRNPVSDALALRALTIICECLPALKHNLANLELRTSLLQASLLAGLAFSNTQTALAHSISYPLTAIFGIPHGLACSLPLPQLVTYNGRAYPEFLTKISNALGSKPSTEAISGRLNRLFEQLEVSPKLSDYGVRSENIELICRETVQSARIANNVAEVTEDSLFSTIKMML